MENWLKWLVAAACCVIIAAGGYYAWSEYKNQQAEAQLAEFQAMRSKCLETLSKAEEGVSVPGQTDLQNCILSGAINNSDIDSSIARIRAKKSGQ